MASKFTNKHELYFNGRFLTQSITGVQRFAIELLKDFDHLLDRQPNLRKKYIFKLITPKNTLETDLGLKHIQLVSKGFLKGHFWEQLQLPFLVKKRGLINLCNTGPAFKRNQLVVIHDAAVFTIPQNFSFKFRFFYKTLFKLLAVISKSILTVSEFSKTELLKFLPIKRSKITVVYEGHEHILNTPADNTILKKHGLSPKGFLFALSSLNPNKNFGLIANTAAQFPMSEIQFVFAGGTNDKVFKEIKLPSSKNIKYLGYINDNELRALLDNALCFVFPSFYEGFGLPPLEAMACGCPTIVSNIPTLKEIGSNGVLYCDPYDSNSLTKLVTQIVENKKLQIEFSQKGKLRSACFSWKKTSEILFQQISNLN